ncbi:hypothetical protein Taro_024220 [Colocasia esculenta]|uniref:Uncharacterized protein n=1 Tax=Colocasia esculenta TaxID=4460 RepID=A0A843UZQ3_COLES|nr:hypothetical protein [Colocasia esculenta]
MDYEKSISIVTYHGCSGSRGTCFFLWDLRAYESIRFQTMHEKISWVQSVSSANFLIHSKLKDYQSLYEGYVPMKYKKYYKKMAKSGEWGDHVTLQAAADKEKSEKNQEE